MPSLNDIFEQLLHQFSSAGSLYGFLEVGGPVLVAVMAISFVMWLLILERSLFLAFVFPAQVKEAHGFWGSYLKSHQGRGNKWGQLRVRASLISELRLSTRTSLGLIATLVALAPLMGLLGTVTGMLEVFDIIAITGSNNARTLAAGIAKATIPTMAGMVTALSGIYFSTLIRSWAEKKMIAARNKISLEEGSVA